MGKTRLILNVLVFTAMTMSFASASFYAQNISGAQRLPNGNTLIC
jgi:hypothetical protein